MNIFHNTCIQLIMCESLVKKTKYKSSNVITENLNSVIFVVCHNAVMHGYITCL